MRTFYAVAAAALFLVLATANSGGYRYGASDQAFYVPAIAMSAEPTLFPRDRPLFAPQMRLWLGDSVFGWLASATGSIPAVFAAMYVSTLIVLFAAAITLGRGLGADWPAVAAFAALLTLKHQITRTGANSLEGYAHPRMLAFAIGIAAFAFLVTRRRTAAIVAVGVAAIVHITTALWFGAAIGGAILWNVRRRSSAVLTAGAVAAIAVAGIFATMSDRLIAMDPAWIAALGDRSYLFPAEWPLSAWILNLSYPVVLLAAYRRRRALGILQEGESGLIAGLVALVALFALSVPLTALRLALAVQLQISRIFWLLDAVAAFYVAWWLVSDFGRRAGRNAGWAIVAVIVAASAARGAYLLGVTPARPALEFDLPASQWTDVMRWIAGQPERWHVFADPQHVARFGPSVRVAALRDTLLDTGKDPALAIYDRDAARRVLERATALADFDAFTTADVRALASRYNLDVFVDRASRRFELPILYRNDGFIAYDLR